MRALGVQVDVRRRLVEDRGSAGRRSARGRTRRAGAGRPRAGRRARRPRCRSPSGSASMNVPRRRPRAAAASTSSARRVRAGRSAMFSPTVPLNRNALLRHDPHLRAQRRAARTSRRSWPSTSTRPLGRVVEARDELGERRLAGAGRADERDGLARRDVQRRRRSSACFGAVARCGRRTSTSSKRISPRSAAAARSRRARRRGRAARRAARRSCRAPPCPTGRSCRAARAGRSGRRSRSARR